MYNPINCPDIDENREARGADRFELFTETEGMLAQGISESLLVHNLSATGLLLETEAMLESGQRIHIHLPDVGLTAALVVWTGEALYGCRFEQPLSSEALHAAQAQDPLTAHVATASIGSVASMVRTASATAAASAGLAASATADDRAPNITMQLSVRLRRLREAQGLSLAALSRRAGISKPSIWAWETGKTVPRPRSIDALARALGVDAAEIWGSEAGKEHGGASVSAAATRQGTGRGTSPLTHVVASARASIAAAASVSPDSVRISIEY